MRPLTDVGAFESDWCSIIGCIHVCVRVYESVCVCVKAHSPMPMRACVCLHEYCLGRVLYSCELSAWMQKWVWW